MKRVFMVVLAGMALLAAGCITDISDNDGKKDTPTKISQLSMGGGVFYFKKEGYGVAQFGTFYGTDPYENAKMFVNGLELQNNLGIFSNTQPLTSALIDTGKAIHLAVYALGDSVVKDIALPEPPVISKPLENAQLTVGDSLYVGISYPGTHQIISMALSKQDDIAGAMETSREDVVFAISGAKIINAGESTITAISANASGPIPSNFNINNQYTVFLVGSATSRVVNFVKK